MDYPTRPHWLQKETEEYRHAEDERSVTETQQAVTGTQGGSKEPKPTHRFLVNLIEIE